MYKALVVVEEEEEDDKLNKNRRCKGAWLLCFVGGGWCLPGVHERRQRPLPPRTAKCCLIYTWSSWFTPPISWRPQSGQYGPEMSFRRGFGVHNSLPTLVEKNTPSYRQQSTSHDFDFVKLYFNFTLLLNCNNQIWLRMKIDLMTDYTWKIASRIILIPLKGLEINQLALLFNSPLSFPLLLLDTQLSKLVHYRHCLSININ